MVQDLTVSKRLYYKLSSGFILDTGHIAINMILHSDTFVTIMATKLTQWVLYCLHQI